jgi:hypothetical protein
MLAGVVFEAAVESAGVAPFGALRRSRRLPLPTQLARSIPASGRHRAVAKPVGCSEVAVSIVRVIQVERGSRWDPAAAAGAVGASGFYLPSDLSPQVLVCEAIAARDRRSLRRGHASRSRLAGASWPRRAVAAPALARVAGARRGSFPAFEPACALLDDLSAHRSSLALLPGR